MFLSFHFSLWSKPQLMAWAWCVNADMFQHVIPMWWFRLVIFRFLLCVCVRFSCCWGYFEHRHRREPRHESYAFTFNLKRIDVVQFIHCKNVTLDCGDFMCPPKGSKTDCIAGESWWFQRNRGCFTSSWNSNILYDMLKTDACFELFWGASHTSCFPDPVCYSAFV